ncbi:MAG: hypothetical protein QOE69_1396 [Thermoleophilaceae bacterium]|jgi:hypothetical protein|nr:hypothetical protein [Thermoleophilaceae bacterium]MEA2407277.1 hypothetical protein [Thermoleophilaceae bacterium]
MATRDFRGLRRDIGIALNGRSRTLYETAKAVGRRSGDIQRVVRQMHAEGILQAGDAEPTRGTEYWLDERYADALEEAVTDAQPPGMVSSEQRMLELRAPEVGALYAVLGQRHLSTLISWAAEWGGDGEWLIALARGTSKMQGDQLTKELQDAGFHCRQLRIGEVVEGRRLPQMAQGFDEPARSRR